METERDYSAENASGIHDFPVTRDTEPSEVDTTKPVEQEATSAPLPFPQTTYADNGDIVETDDAHPNGDDIPVDDAHEVTPVKKDKGDLKASS